jgi:hypothetical protein
MKLVRSWPAVIPEGRSYVVDDIPRFIMGNDGDRQYDYRGLVELDADVVLIEWDIAINGDHLAAFMARAKAEPDRVRVAPYVLYRKRSRDSLPQIGFYVHRIRTREARCWARGPQDTHCQMFGFGLVYLPQVLIERFVAQMDPKSHFGDSEFSRWHMRNVTPCDVPIDWDLPAVHLHYNTPEVP